MNNFSSVAVVIDENGEVIFDCELQERDKHKSFPITIEDEEYIIVGTGQCNAIAHQKSTNPFCLTLNKDDEANIRHIRIYKEQDKVDLKKQEQIDIYTAQVEKREDTATQQTSTDDIHTSQTPLQENQNLIHLEAHLTSGKALKKDIHWAYYVKYRNEPLWEKSKIKKENLESLTFTQKSRESIEAEFEGKGYGHLKMALAEVIIESLRPIQQSYAKISQDKTYIQSVLTKSADSIRPIAKNTYENAKRLVGLV